MNNDFEISLPARPRAYTFKHDDFEVCLIDYGRGKRTEDKPYRCVTVVESGAPEFWADRQEHDKYRQATAYAKQVYKAWLSEHPEATRIRFIWKELP